MGEGHVGFIWEGHPSVVRDPGLRRYGAIVWESGMDVNEAIRAVKAFSDPNDAIRYAVPACHLGGHWAVVDLATMDTVAQGRSPTIAIGV
jgi:hypothetical protein